MPRLAPPSTSKPIPVPRRRSIRAQSGGAEQVISVAVSFSTQRKAECRRSSPARYPPGSHRLRGQIRLPLGQPVRALGHPTSHGRRIPVAHRPPQHRQCKPVDLEVDDPGDVGARDDPLPLLAIRCAIRIERSSSVARGRLRSTNAHRGDHERRQRRPAEVVDPEQPVESPRRRSRRMTASADQHRARSRERASAAAAARRARRSPRSTRRRLAATTAHPRSLVDVDTEPGSRLPPSPRPRWRTRRRGEGTAASADVSGCRAVELAVEPSRDRLVAQVLSRLRVRTKTSSAASPLRRRRRQSPGPDSSRCRLLPRPLLGVPRAFCSATLTLASVYDSVTSSLPPVQAEDADDQDQSESDVPGGGDQLLRGRVVDSDAVATPQQVSSASALVACVMPTAPGVNETTLASEPDPVTHMTDSNVTGIAKAARKIPITVGLAGPARGTRAGTSRGSTASGGARSRAALLGLCP